MNARTLKALRGSIKKWEAIVAGTGVDQGTDNCPLCEEFFDDWCKGCPVNDASGNSCNGTPYEAWEEAHYDPGIYFNDRTIKDDDSAIAAVLELEFLRSLLPGPK
jgi:hypothetical protein